MMMKTKMKLQKYLYLYLALWLVFSCVVFMIWMSDYTLLIGTSGTAFLLQRILNWGAAACGMLLAVRHYHKTEKTPQNRIILTVAVAGIAFTLLCWNFLCAFFDSMEEYHSFTSPDGRHTIVTIVIMENVDAVCGQVVLYERVNPFLIYPRERIITDDGYRPVCAGKYTLVWEGDTVTLSVFDGAGETRTVTVRLNER